MGREFELKYTATRAQQDALAASFGEFTSIAMETTYYDTPDGALSRQHITLRRRFENGVSVCTVKTPGDGHGRGEWDCDCERIEDAIPVLRGRGCDADLEELTKSGLVPICGARFTRQAKLVDLGGCEVELALDRGTLLGGGREVPLCEVEVELKSGEEAMAVAFAAQLAKKFGLQPERNSKFRRALMLAKGEDHG